MSHKINQITYSEQVIMTCEEIKHMKRLFTVTQFVGVNLFFLWAFRLAGCIL